jgi:hypothetical protein
MKSINEFIDISLRVQLWSKWNYMINIWCQLIDSSILNSLCQAKQEKHMNNKKRNINLVQHLWLAHNQERIDQVLLLSIGYLWKQLDHKKKIFKMSLWKTWSNVWDMMIVEEWLTRTWPRWIMHRRRVSGGLNIEVPDVMEKVKWMFESEVSS